MQVMYPAVTLSQVPKYLRVATTEEEFREIWKLRQAEFGKLYPACTHFEDDATMVMHVFYIVKIQ